MGAVQGYGFCLSTVIFANSSIVSVEYFGSSAPIIYKDPVVNVSLFRSLL